MLPSLRPAKRLLFAVFLLLLPAAFSFAQITNVTNDTSTPIPGAGHDYFGQFNETVNPANGSLSLRIGVGTPPGRRLTLPFSVAYDSNGVHHLFDLGVGQAGWGSNSSYLGAGGWTYSVPQLSDVHLNLISPIDQRTHCYVSTAYVFGDPGGGRHSLKMDVNLTYNLTKCNSFFSHTAASDDLYQAYTAVTSLPPVTIADADGTVFHFPNPTHETGSAELDTYEGFPDFVEDRNGNKITITDSGNGAFSYTDTLGRQAVAVNGFGHTGNTITVSGLASPYTLTWGSVTRNIPPPSVYQVTSDSYCTPPQGDNSTDAVITAISLPNSTQYTFSYDPTYGLISKITYPTGGYVRYAYGTSPLAEFGMWADNNGNSTGCKYEYDTIAVAHRYVSFDGNPSHEVLQQDFSYSTTWNPSDRTHWTSKSTTVTTTVKAVDLNGTLTTIGTFSTTYSYASVPAPPSPYYMYSSFAGQIPVEDAITYNPYQGTSGTVRTVKKKWSDPYEMTCASTTQDSQTSRIDYTYGAGAQVTDKKEWDWGQAPDCSSSPSGSPGRETITAYHSFGATPIFTNGSSIFDRPDSVKVYGDGALAAETDYVYDGASLSSATATQHDDSNYGVSYTNRGNATQKTQVLLNGCQGCTSPYTSYAYDVTGQVVTMVDAGVNSGNTRGTTSYAYSDQNAYLSQVTYPSTGVAHTQGFDYDFASGNLTSSTDFNGKTTTYAYSDPLDRLTFTMGPALGSTAFDGVNSNACASPNSPETANYYSDTPGATSVTVSKLLCGQTSAPTVTYLDGMGQTKKVLAPNNASTDTAYDGLGRVWKVTNPYFSVADPTYGVTTYTYDVQGRVTNITRQDGNNVATVYSGCWATVTDEAGETSQRCTDALGRLTKVIDGLSNETDYSYDALDNLRTVTQGAQTRTFGFDSLSRLTGTTNPESGTINCSLYDGNRNLLTRTDARGITTTYTYDALNRNLSKSYSDGSTPTASFFYDETSVPVNGTYISVYNTNGRMSHWTTTSSGSIKTMGIYSYHPTGWVQDLWECTPLDCATVNNTSMTNGYYEYDLAGDLGYYSSPSHSFFVYPYVNSAQQISQVTSTWADSTHPGTLASFAYNPAGSISTLADGCTGTGCAGLLETYNYNRRLQMDMVELGTGSNRSSQWCMVYNYYSTSPPGSCTPPGSAVSGNNGNVRSLHDFDSMYSANAHTSVYTYDAVNRLTSATGAANWQQSYSYDRFGNGGCSSGSAPCTRLTFNTSTNRIATINGSSSGIGFDNAGNLLGNGTGTGSETYTWDAENRVTSVSVQSITTVQYTYNALGQRVQKHVSSPASDTYYYHDAFSNIAGTRSASTWTEQFVPPVAGKLFAKYQDGVTYFLHGDVLASVSIVTNQANTGIQDLIYSPWGFVQGGMNGGAQKDERFASMLERDQETQLDPTPNRQYANGIFRWLSSDPAGTKAAKLDDPQTWNMYAYVRNNPTTFTDPTGLDLWERGCGKETATCHKNYVGSYNDKGKFVRTTIQSDANGNFQGHTVNFNTSGIHIDSKYRGVFASGTAATVVNGAGNLSGFQGAFSTNCLGTCAAGGVLSALPGHSFSELLPTLRGPNESLDTISFTHEGAQYRGGNYATPDLHLSYTGGNDPQSMHFDWRYPFGSQSGLEEHAEDLMLYETRSKVLGWTGDPPDEYVHPSDEP
jgi:RHS repeat-associated protein